MNFLIKQTNPGGAGLWDDCTGIDPAHYAGYKQIEKNAFNALDCYDIASFLSNGRVGDDTFLPNNFKKRIKNNKEAQAVYNILVEYGDNALSVAMSGDKDTAKKVLKNVLNTASVLGNDIYTTVVHTLQSQINQERNDKDSNNGILADQLLKEVLREVKKPTK